MKTVVNKKGKKVILLDPAERGRKYAKELKHGAVMTRDGKFKLENGVAIELTDTQASYRSGYLDSRKDNAKAYKSNEKKKAAKPKKK